MAASTTTTTHRFLRLLVLLLLPLVALGFVPLAPALQNQHRATTVAAAAPAAAATETGVVAETLILPMGDDTQLKIRFRQESFKTLALRTNQLLASFRTLKAAAAEADGVPGSVRLEPTFLFEARDFDTQFFLECNPNIYPDAFHATVFVKVNNGVWEVTSQCQLSALVDALKMYKATYKVQLEPPAASQ